MKTAKLRFDEESERYVRGVQPLPKLGSFQMRLDARLQEDNGRSRRERLRITGIYDLALRQGFDDEYAAVRRVGGRPGVAT